MSRPARKIPISPGRMLTQTASATPRRRPEHRRAQARRPCRPPGAGPHPDRTGPRGRVGERGGDDAHRHRRQRGPSRALQSPERDQPAEAGARLHPRDARVNSPNPARSTVRRPNRSPMDPEDSIRLAVVIVYAAMVHCSPANGGVQAAADQRQRQVDCRRVDRDHEHAQAADAKGQGSRAAGRAGRRYACHGLASKQPQPGAGQSVNGHQRRMHLADRRGQRRNLSPIGAIVGCVWRSVGA